MHSSSAGLVRSTAPTKAIRTITHTLSPHIDTDLVEAFPSFESLLRHFRTIGDLYDGSIVEQIAWLSQKPKSALCPELKSTCGTKALLQSSFHLDYPSNPEHDFIGQDRTFVASSNFSAESEGEHHSSAGSLEQPLVHHPDALPVTNGLRYTATHPVVHEVPSFQTVNGILVSPIDSSGESVSTSPDSAASSFAFSSLSNVFRGNVSSTEGYPPTPVSVYTQSATFPQWNAAMSDPYRHRVSAIQPPLSMSPLSQSQGTPHLTAPPLLGNPGREGYPPPQHHGHRTPFSGHSHDPMSRPTFATTRAIEIPVSPLSPSNTVYSSHSNNMMIDAAARQEQGGMGAPPFDETKVLRHIHSSNSRQGIHPDIHAKIHKGFFQVDQKWTCYRRNYFSVACSFSVRPPQGSTQLFLQRPNGSGSDLIQSFAVTISAVVNGVGGEIRNLIQHTPKRSKDTEEPPKKIRIHPLQPNLNLNSIPSSTSIPFSFSPGMSQSNGIKQDYDPNYGSGNAGPQNQTSHTFERIQFQRATANNGKRRAQQQYYHVVVELYAELSRPVGTPDSGWGSLEKIATKMSAPMVVRGRSPGHYKDGRRDSSASGMGRDGSGGAGNGGSGSILPPPMSGPGSITRYSMASEQSNSHMGRGDYRSMTGVSYTPITTSPIHSSPTSGFGEDGLEDDDGDPMDTSDYVQNEYSTGSEVDLHGNATPANGYRIQLPAIEFPRVPADNFNDGSTSFSFPFLSSSGHSMRQQTQRPTEHYHRTEYGHSSDRNSHVPWLTNGHYRDPMAAASATWSGTPYASRFEAVNSA